MVTVLSPVESFGAAMGRALGGAAGTLGQGFAQRMATKKEDKSLEKMGLGHLIGLSPELKKLGFAQHMKQKQDKALEKEQTLQSLKGTIEQLRGLAESDAEGLGVAGQYYPSKEGFYNRAKLKTLGSDLLSFYKSLFPRGITQQEFIRLEKDYIPKPGDPISSMKGKLDAFEDLIKRKLKETEGTEGKEGEKGKVKFNPKNSEHVAKYRQLEKKFGNDAEKINAALAREFTL